MVQTPLQRDEYHIGPSDLHQSKQDESTVQRDLDYIQE
jgi:hypothetical protein